MTTAWANLPNAKHIDRILDDLKKNPDNWSAAADSAAWSTARATARDVAWTAARLVEFDASRVATNNDAWDAAKDAAWNALKLGIGEVDARDVAWSASWSASLALIAFDDCAYLLDEKPEDVLILGLLGIHAAVLLYPACVALQKEMA